MKHQIEDTVSQFKDIFDFQVTFPCAQNLWNVNDEAEFSDDENSDLFHLLTDKLLFITKKTIPDIEPAVELLTTRVAKINVDDWNKLIRCI